MMWISKKVFLVKPPIALLVLTIAGYYENISNNSIKSKSHIALKGKPISQRQNPQLIVKFLLENSRNSEEW